MKGRVNEYDTLGHITVKVLKQQEVPEVIDLVLHFMSVNCPRVGSLNCSSIEYDDIKNWMLVLHRCAKFSDSLESTEIATI